MAAVIGKRMEQAPTQVGNGSIPHTVKARPPFFFMVASRGWEFVESDGCWLPVLKRHYIDPGVNGITASRNPSQAYSEREQRGFAVIRPEDARLGEFRHYVQTLPYQGGGSYCLSVFEAAEVMPGGRVFIQRDEAEYNRFRRHLVASGMVPPLDPRWKRELLGEMRQTLNRKAARAAAAMPGSPAHAKFATYEAWFKAAEAADGPTDEAKPKRSRARAEA